MTERSEGEWDVDEESIEEEQNYISDDLRFEVLDRDGWRCQKCGEADPDLLTLHHVLYRSQGGKDKASNLVVVCWRCHRSIHDGQLAVKWIQNGWYFRVLK